MHDPKNAIRFNVWGRYALFTDPLTKLGGEKCSYHVPTYEALKGVAKSIYWKPTLTWVIDEVRVLNRIRTQTKNMKPLNYGGGNDLAIYTYLADVSYEVVAHFEWNTFRPELKADRIDGKHFAMARRCLERGGRQDIFLGTRDCQGYVQPQEPNAAAGHYDGAGELAFGVMFHGFDYPDETGGDWLEARFWRPTMVDGVIRFPRPEQCDMRKRVRPMRPKSFEVGKNVKSVEADGGTS